MSSPEFIIVSNGPVDLRVAVQGEGPLILFIHGWPELWYSWRHQLSHFSKLGFTAAAMDVRGYGGSSKPAAVEAYTLTELARDAACVIETLSNSGAIVVGHDWGAPITYATAMQHPERVTGVAGLSIPFRPASEIFLLDVAKHVFAEKFFYMLYFQQHDVPEAELEADVFRSLRTIYYSASADAPPGSFMPDKPAEAGFLDGMKNPAQLPAWITENDLSVYVEAFRQGGFRGPINRYRAQFLDFEASRALVGKPLAQPACFIGGADDPVRAMIPGMDLFADIEAGYEDLRINELIEGAGHWLQQESPDATNALLEGFVNTIQFR